MKKSILNLEGVAVLTKTQQKNTFGGLADGGFGGGSGSGPDTCKATCNNGTTANASSCDKSQADLACSGNEGSKSCECGVKGPLDPPGGN